MVISDAQLEAFIQLYKSHYGVAISKEAAYEQGVKLLVMLEYIYQPVSKSVYDSVQAEQFEVLKKFLEQSSLQHSDTMAP